MNLDTVNTKLGSVRERIMELQKREKDLSEQKAMMEDAATMKIIKKHKISSEKLQLLNKLSEDEIFRLLAEREKEIKNHGRQTKILYYNCYCIYIR